MNRFAVFFPAIVFLASGAFCAGERPAVVLQQTVSTGLSARGVDLKNPVAVLGSVFAQLPDEVDVLPTENYFYWQLYCDGREVRGNLRLASGLREKGVLCLGYAEYDEFPADGGPQPEISEAKFFDKADGVDLSCPDAFTALVRYKGKSVTFRLNRLNQSPPQRFNLPADEKFLQRTCDESGFQFHLLYNSEKKYFLWVLDEEVTVPDHFHLLAEDVVLGRRSGFVFWIDRANGKRKVLAAVRDASIERNDWFDGPFDQLADNFADQTNIRHFIEEGLPECRGRIDKWGYFTDEGERPNRVALNNYGTWTIATDAVKFIERAEKSGDIRQFISRGGADWLAGSGDQTRRRAEKGQNDASTKAKNVRK